MSRQVIVWTVAMLLSALVVACEGDQETAEEPMDPVRLLCEAANAHDEECGDQPQSLQECMYDDDSACFYDLVRSQVLIDAVSCIAELPCGDNMLYCIYLAGEESPVEGQAEYLSSCSTKREACNTSFGDYCETPYLRTDMYERMTACLSLDCDQVFDCLKGARPASCQ